MKLVFGMEVGLRPADFVLDGDPILFPEKGAEPLPNFRPISIVTKRLHEKRFALCYPSVVCPVCLSCLSSLWSSCTVAKRLDGSRWNLACR